jgi:hypothetical protein
MVPVLPVGKRNSADIVVDELGVIHREQGGRSEGCKSTQRHFPFCTFDFFPCKLHFVEQVD